MADTNEHNYNAVDALILCLETSNELLNLIYKSSLDPHIKGMIAKIIDGNAVGIVEALDSSDADKLDSEETFINPELLKQMFGEGVQIIEISELSINKAVGMLEEIQDAYYLKDKIQPIINILKDGI